jgi:SAM-dependent methyltransferase
MRSLVPGLRTALRSLGVHRPGTVARLEQRVRTLEARNDRLRDRTQRLVSRRDSLAQDLAEARRSATTAVAEVPGLSRLELRRRCVLKDSAPDTLALEIGPAHNGILTKRDGYRTRTVDYLDREGLVTRYQDFSQYDPADIEEVDYVLPPGAAMSEVITERFDLIVASHVIEHTVSMVDFLDECAKLLTPHGTLALVVPDHRYCFDRFRERASLARVIDASLSPPAVHTVGTVIEERLNAVRHRGTTAWMPGHTGSYSFVHDLPAVLESGEEARRGDRYIDTHNWISTPNHMRLLLQDLYDLGLITLRETFFHDTVRHEYFINLSPAGPGSGLSREQLQVLADDERRCLDHARFADRATS